MNQARPLIVPGLFHRGARIAGALVATAGLVLCSPFVILAIGIPIALFLRVLLWLAGML